MPVASEPSRPRPGDLLAVLVLVVLALGCFSRLVAQPGALLVDGDRPSIDAHPVGEPRGIGNDLTFTFLPHHLHIAAEVARLGRLPLWDTSGFAGRPLVGNPQAGLFYPPVWIAWWSRSPAALGWLTVGHLIWGALGAYTLTRSLGAGQFGSTVAAGCFEASPYLLAHTFEGHVPHVWAACWYPWAFWAFSILRKGDPRGAIALAPILALTFLTGHPQEWYYLVVALSLWRLVDVVRFVSAGRMRAAIWTTVIWAGIVGVCLGMVAVELVPDLAAQGFALRSGRLSMARASGYHLAAIHLFQLLSPGALGGPADFIGPENSWETMLSIGLVPLVLATIAVARHPDRASVRGWLIVILAALVFAAGRKLGLFALLFQLAPGMDRFRVPARSLFLASLGASVLAGLGIEMFTNLNLSRADWSELKRRLRQGAMIVLAGLLVGQVSAWVNRPDVGGRDRASVAVSKLVHDRTFWFALIGMTVTMAAATHRPVDRRAAGFACGVLALVELGLHGHAVLQVAPAERFLGPDPISAALAKEALPSIGPFRIRARDSLYTDLRAIGNKIEKVNVNDSFQIQHAADLYETLYPLLFPQKPIAADDRMGEPVACFRREVRQGVLDRLSVAFLVSDHVEPDVPWPVVATGSLRGSSYVIQRNPTVLPRAYVVPRAFAAEDKRSTVLALISRIDPREFVLLPSDPLGSTGDRQPFTPAEWRSSNPDRLVLGVTTRAPGLLVVADTWMPGWTARVNGKPVPILRGNHAQRVIPLTHPGRHTVILEYESPGLRLGCALTIASILVWAMIFSFPRSALFMTQKSQVEGAST